MDAVNLYGQRSQPEETPEFLSKSHDSLLEEIDKLPHERKAGWLLAQERCHPTLVGEEHRLLFLRCELFDAKLAAQRITNYWNRRIELFGQNRAFKPLHLGEDGALSTTNPCNNEGATENNNDDKLFVEHTLKGLSLGFIRAMQRHDSGGRAILFADPSRFAGYDKNNNEERMGVARAMWLVFHQVIMGDEMVQKLGVVVIVFPHHAKLSTIDRKLIKMNVESISGALPLRVGGFHICHPPWFFGKIIYPLMKVIMPTRMSKRIRVHVGSEEKVLDNLKQYGLERNVLPSDIGGDVVLGTDEGLHQLIGLR